MRVVAVCVQLPAALDRGVAAAHTAGAEGRFWEVAMGVERIARDDIMEALAKGRLEALAKGRSILGRVTEVSDGIVYFRPICPGAGWRHAKARDGRAQVRDRG